MILHEGVRKERRTMTETRKKSPSRSLANSSGIHAEIDAGVCGFKTTVEADPDGPRSIHLTIESDCAQIQKAAPSLTEIDMLEESKAGVGRGRVYYELAQCVKHVTCPVHRFIRRESQGKACVPGCRGHVYAHTLHRGSRLKRMPAGFSASHTHTIRAQDADSSREARSIGETRLEGVRFQTAYDATQQTVGFPMQLFFKP